MKKSSKSLVEKLKRSLDTKPPQRLQGAEFASDSCSVAGDYGIGIGYSFSQILSFCIVLALTIAVYANGLDGDFLVDDRPLIVETSDLTLANGLKRFFLSGMWNFSSLHISDQVLYRPVFLLFLALQKDAFGLQPVGFHIVALLLHLLNCVLLFAFLRRLFPQATAWAPVLGMAAFALHPIHVEAVSWISAQSHLLATGLVLGALISHIRFVEGGSWGNLAFGAILFLLGTLSQEIVLAYPLILLALSLLLKDRRHAIGAGAVAASLLVYLAMRRVVLDFTVPAYPMTWAKWQTFFEFSILSIRNLVIPWPQPFYLETPHGEVGPLSIAATLLALTAAWWGIQTGRGRNAMFMGILWILLGILPSLSAAFNSPPRYSLRCLYWGSGGLAVLVTWMAAVGTHRIHRRTIFLGVGLLLLASAMAVVVANRTWQNDATAYGAAIRFNPDSSAGYEKLALFYERGGHLAKAIENYQSAAQRSSGDALATNLENVGHLSAMSSLIPEAELALRQAALLAPTRSSIWVGLGNVAYMQGHLEEALKLYQRGFALDQGNYEACYNLVLVLTKLKRFSDARKYETKLATLHR
ncbi:MAG: tetratricopeptide repeat protein [Nitrospirae bacterium]|nr:tetratricopeptide repeat protein [Nitrospirota bacterium]